MFHPFLEELPLFYSNYDLENVVTPVNVSKFRDLLEATGYPKDKLNFY